MGRRKQNSCHQCRTRHLRCDGQQPCAHCRRGVRDCTKETTHVFLDESNLGIVRRKKKYDLSFGGDQRWIDVPSSVTFAADFAAFTSSDDSGPSAPITPTGQYYGHDSQSPPASWENYDLGTYQPFIRHDLGETSFLSRQDGASQLLEPFQNSSFPHDGIIDPALQEKSPNSSDSSYGARWPLQTFEEARIFRYFVTDIACWFDMGDSVKHFTCIIPELAHDCPALLNAILALSSKHLSLLGELEESVTLRYQDACFKALLPDLQERAFEAPSLAAVIMLRLVVQMTDPRGADPQTSPDIFLGIDVFLNAWRANLDSGLHGAIFINVLRLYVHVALTNQRPLDILQSNSMEPSRVWDWKASMFCARVINFVYDSQPKTLPQWLKLDKSYHDWHANRPAYFEPIFQQDPRNGDPFPKMVFSNGSHVMSFQYMCISRMLLLNNRPRGNCECPGLTGKAISDECLSLLRKALGATECHRESTAVLLISTLLISLSGHLLPSRIEQEHAMRLMETAQAHCAGIMAADVLMRLRRSWGWAVD